MFDSFQFHPRPSNVASGQHFGNFRGCGLHAMLCQDASETRFSSSFKAENLSGSATSEVFENQSEISHVALCLSPREQDVLAWAARGKSAWETAQLLGLSEATVKSYVRNACKRLQVQNKTHAVAIALTQGLIRL